ncbi:glutamate--tRNA ligase family protein, partial [Staphylococcus aureus]
YLPDALFNFLALLGWSPEGDEAIFSKDEFITIFDEKRLSQSPAFFDKQQLAWVNHQYMKQQDTDTVFQLALPHLIKANMIPEVPS